jgi:hypothetical protein
LLPTSVTILPLCYALRRSLHTIVPYIGRSLPQDFCSDWHVHTFYESILPGRLCNSLRVSVHDLEHVLLLVYPFGTCSFSLVYRRYVFYYSFSLCLADMCFSFVRLGWMPGLSERPGDLHMFTSRYLGSSSTPLGFPYH